MTYFAFAVSFNLFKFDAQLWYFYNPQLSYEFIKRFETIFEKSCNALLLFVAEDLRRVRDRAHMRNVQTFCKIPNLAGVYD